MLLSVASQGCLLASRLRENRFFIFQLLDYVLDGIGSGWDEVTF